MISNIDTLLNNSIISILSSFSGLSILVTINMALNAKNIFAPHFKTRRAMEIKLTYLQCNYSKQSRTYIVATV